MGFTRDEKLMLIVALGESSQELEESVWGYPSNSSFEVFVHFIEGHFYIPKNTKAKLVELFEYPTFKALCMGALTQQYFGYDSKKFEEEEFENLALKVDDLPIIYENILSKLKEEL